MYTSSEAALVCSALYYDYTRARASGPISHRLQKNVNRWTDGLYNIGSYVRQRLAGHVPTPTDIAGDA